MKKLLNIALAVVVIFGAIGWFTYMGQYSRQPPVVTTGPSIDSSDGKPAIALTVPHRIAVWDSNDEQYAAEFEKGSHGRYDFWVSNANPKPVDVHLAVKGCTCSEVLLALVPPDTIVEFAHRVAPLDLAANLVGGPNFAAPFSAPLLTQMAEKLQWETLLREPGHKLVVPAADSRTGTQIAVLRLKWDTREPQPQRLTAVIDHRLPGLVENHQFEVPIKGVLPLMVSTPALTVPDLNYNEVRETGFYCFSSTRPDLKVKVEEVTHDPCIEVSPPRTLTEQEMGELPQRMNLAGLRLKCAYHVAIKVHERRGSHQLDLGPLLRKISINAGPDTDSTVMLHSWVRTGALRIGDPADKDRIDLGNFRMNKGVEKVLRIVSTEPGLQLKVESRVPDVLKVTLAEIESSGPRKEWELSVEVPAGRISGPILAGSAIVLQTVGPQQRKVKIPVVGNGTQ